MASLDETLLPAVGDAPRCAAFAESLGVDPGGTALHVDELIVAEVGPPWPKPVWAKDGFTAVPDWVLAAEAAGRRVRVLAAMPDPDRERPAVVVHRRDGTGMRPEAHRVAGTDVAALLETLLTHGPDASPATIEVGAGAARSFLVCTQGSHDVCCGSRGPVLAAAIAAARPDVEVRRVSHTGGHRFAPTGVSLPDGRMWGGVDVDDCLAILDRQGSPAALASRCRGWIGAPAGPPQVAERAVLALLDDWSFDTAERSVTPLSSVDDRVTCRVEASGRAWVVDVVLGRAVPTIACGAPGGLPAKPGSEWRVASLQEA